MRDELLDTEFQRAIVNTERQIVRLEASIPSQVSMPDSPGNARSDAELKDMGLAYEDIGKAINEPVLELPEVTITGKTPRFRVTDPRINDGAPSAFDTLEEAKQQAGTPEPLASIEETVGESSFAETLKTAGQQDAAKNFVTLLNIPVEHLAGFLAKGDVTQAATPEELGDTILTPFSETLRGALTEKQFRIMAMATGLLAMAVVDPMNPLLMAGKVAKATATLAQPEFKNALSILKSERGSIPVGGSASGDPLIRKRFNVEATEAQVPPSSLAQRVTNAINARTAELTDEAGDLQAKAMIDSGEIDLESLKVLLPGTAFTRPAEALAAHNLIKREQGLFLDTATMAVKSGDPVLVEQAFAQLYGMVESGAPVSGAATILAQMLRRASSPEMKAFNIVMERAAKTGVGQSKLEMLREILADVRTDPAAQGKTHTPSFRAVISGAKEIVEHGDEAQAELWVREVQAAVESDTQLSMFVTEKEVVEAQKVIKNITAQHIVEANQAAIAKADKDTFELTPTGPGQPKKPQADYLKEAEKNKLITTKEHQAQDLRASAGESAFDAKRTPFKLTAPAGGAKRQSVPRQTDLLALIAKEPEPEQLALEMAASIESPERSKQFLKLINAASRAAELGNAEEVGTVLGKLQDVFKDKAIALESVKQPTRLVGLEKKAFEAFFRQAENRGLSPRDTLAAFVQSMPKDGELIGLLKELKTPTGWDVWTDHFYNGMLLALAPIKNLVGTPVMLAAEVAQRGVMAGIDAGGVGLVKMLAGVDLPRSVYMGEVGAMLNLRANLEAFQTGMVTGWHAFKTGKPEFDVSKLEHTIPDISNTALWLNTTGPMGQATAWMTTAQRRWTNKGIDMASTIGGRLLLSGDTLNKVVAHQAQRRALALREAYATVEREGLTDGAEIAQRVLDVKRDVMAHPERYPELQDEAKRFAQYVAFQEELGKAGESLRNLAGETTLGPRGKLGGLSGFPIGRFLAPFTSIAANMGKVAGEYSGPLQLLSPAIHAELNADGPRRLAALAKISFSTVLLDALYQNAGEGLFTGNGPRDVNANEQWQAATGKIPNAWWDPLSKQYRSCTAFEPFCTLTSAVADMHDMMSATPPEQVDSLLPAFQALVVTVMNNAGIKEYTQGLGGIMNLSHTGEFDSYQDWFAHAFAQAAVPYSGALRQVIPSVDPAMRHATTVIEQLKKNIPTLSETLAVERNGLGKIKFRTGGWFNPVSHGIESEDPDIWQAMNEHNYVLGMPLRTLKGVRLNDFLYDEYVQQVTDGLDEALRQKLDTLSPLSDVVFAERVNEIVNRRRLTGEHRFIRENPDLQESIKDTRTRLRSGEQRAPSKFAPGKFSTRPALTPVP